MISVEKIQEPSVTLTVEIDQEGISGLSEEFSLQVPMTDWKFIPDLVEAILNACGSSGES